MGLTLHFMPHSDIENISSARIVHKILEIVKQGKIVVLEGKLKSEEEADLIEITMQNVNKKFKGIEVATLNPKGKDDFRSKILGLIAGNRIGLTVIGPAVIVKDIKKNPGKLELLISSSNKKKKRK